MKKALLLVLPLLVGSLLHSATPGLTSVPFATSTTQFGGGFTGGDSITIQELLATSPNLAVGDTFVVRGTYTLQSQASATMSISLSTTEPVGVPNQDTARKQITAGTGTFEMEYTIQFAGTLYIALTPATGGNSFGRIYFSSSSGGSVTPATPTGPATPVITNPATPSFNPQPVISIDGLTEVPFTTSHIQFANGDSITIRSIFATSSAMGPGDRVVVRGDYQLASQTQAELMISLTATAPGAVTLVASGSHMTVNAGAGTFQLEHTSQQPGDLHVSFYARTSPGASFGGVYFAQPGGATSIALSNPLANTGRFANLSTRSFVGPGDGSLVTGIVVSEQERYVLIRAVGPTLGAFGVTGTLRKPVITVYNTSNEVVATANSWTSMFSTTQRSGLDMLSRSVGAFPLAAGSDDAVLHLRLTPGAYTVVVSSGDGQSGVALMEVYATSTFTLPNN